MQESSKSTVSPVSCRGRPARVAFFARLSPPLARAFPSFAASLVQVLVGARARARDLAGARARDFGGRASEGFGGRRGPESLRRPGRQLSPTATPRRSPRRFCQGRGEIFCKRPLGSAGSKFGPVGIYRTTWKPEEVVQRGALAMPLRYSCSVIGNEFYKDWIIFKKKT